MGEQQARPELTGPELRQLRVPLNEITTTQKCTQKLVDTSRFDVRAWIEGKIADKFARSSAPHNGHLLERERRSPPAQGVGGAA